MGRGIRNRDGVVTLVGVIERSKAGGGALRYLRRKGKPLVKLPDDVPIDSPAFLAAYAAARADDPVRPDASEPGSIAHLVVTALRSDKVKGWSPVYRGKMRNHMDAIRASHGKLPARGAQERHIQADVDAAADSLARLKAWRFLTAHGRRIGILARDPTKDVDVERRQTDGFPPWARDEIASFRDRWPCGTVARAAMELLFWTGARISDVVLIGPGHVGRDGVLAFRQGKTGGWAYVPWTCALPPFADPVDLAHLRAALDAMPGGHMTFLATGRGQTRSHKALGHLIHDAARAAQVERSAHGLRKSRLTSLAERGATTQQIMSWGGHASMSEVEHYTRSAARRAAVIGTETREAGNGTK
jgi:integrase/recombinase XerD